MPARCPRPLATTAHRVDTLRRLVVWLLSVFAIGLAQAPAAAQGAKESNEPGLAAGVLRVGSDLTYPPYDYMRQGVPAGFDVEFMLALANAMNLRVQFVDTRFDRLIPDLSAGRFDVIASALYIKPERERLVDFVPYLRTGVSIAARQGNSRQPRSPEELCGHRVGSIKGAAWLEKLRTLNEGACYTNRMALVEYPASPDATRALMDGSIDVQIEDSAVLLAAILQLHGQATISSSENFYPVVAGLGVRKNDAIVRERLLRGLRRLQVSGCYDELIRKYGVSRPQLVEFYLPLRDESLIQARRRQGKAACDP